VQYTLVLLTLVLSFVLHAPALANDGRGDAKYTGGSGATAKDREDAINTLERMIRAEAESQGNLVGDLATDFLDGPTKLLLVGGPIKSINARLLLFAAVDKAIDKYIGDPTSDWWAAKAERDMKKTIEEAWDISFE
jgi:hypothetical protein